MKLANMLGDRFRETPADCQIISQIFMIRGGYMKQVANGIYSLNMPARRIVRKIENILREEMDAIDGQEVLFPVVMPADLWRESGRYDKIGSELARFKDRSGNDMVLGMTHEEASVQLVRGTPKPESAFPFMIYQIQTKFRDEPRARGGLIRVREFTMKDAYSFHTSQADLEKYYDLEVNETKLRNFVGCEIHPADITEDSGIVKGFIGPVNFKGNARVLFDKSLNGTDNLVCGANEEGYHYTGLNLERDVKVESFCDVAKPVAGGICPVCGKHSINISRGIEVGNIFQLGTKYSHAMGLQFQNKNGGLEDVIMGCYGIGVGRLCASVCEVRHDDYGPIWPISIAPWQVHLCAMRVDKPEVRESADALYDKLQKAGVEVIYDDRAVSAGVMFSDADLLGVPVRVVVSPKTLARGAVEVSARDKSFRQDAAVEYACEEIQGIVKDMLSRCSAD